MGLDPYYTWPVIGALLGLYLLGGFVKGAAAFGQPLVTVSLAAMFMPVPIAIGISVIPSILVNLIQGYASRQAAPRLPRYWPFYLALIIGILIGLRIFSMLDQGALQVIIGCLLIVFSAVQLSGLTPPLSPPPRAPVLAATGLVSGLLAGTTSFVAFPSLPVFIAYGLDRRLFALVTSVMFTITLLMVGGGLTVLGLIGRSELVMGLVCCIPSYLGQRVGLAVRERMSVSALSILVNIILALIGVTFLVRNFAKMLF
ncbi:sulfite exporter TauE/SafE family protein [Amorphus coralli]|uniref:sulfite exporter TauE/SafE family protein n=1 Tax=Amorphus coralli TaxID=340680 RepID=UPI0003646460|nr:sulfite exporter TauE/SafE family protein [Amorphus coralli]